MCEEFELERSIEVRVHLRPWRQRFTNSFSAFRTHLGVWQSLRAAWIMAGLGRGRRGGAGKTFRPAQRKPSA